MRRTLSLLLCLALLFTLSACRFSADGNGDTVTFFYRRVKFAYGEADSVISPETRDISGHAGDLSYLAALYLMGPMNEELVSPFPKSTRLISVLQTGDTIEIELSDIRDDLSDSEFTLACACLTMTCLEASDAEAVTIISGERTVTMNSENLLLIDEDPAAETTNGG